MRRAPLALSLLALAACGPKLPGEDTAGSDATDDTTSDTSVDLTDSDSTDADDPPTSTAAPTTSLPDSTTDATSPTDPATTTTTTTDPTGEPVDPPGPCPDPDDIFSESPYRPCLGGLAEVVAHQFLTGEVGHHAYAQFFTVFAESEVVWDAEILDPFTGLDDCAVRELGHSGVGEHEVVVWEDAGDLTFVGPGFSELAAQSGDPQSVIGYDLSLFDLGVAPAFAGAHGLVTTGATTPALDLPAAVRLPDRLAVQSPALDHGVADRDALDVRWTPSPLALPVELGLNFDTAGGRILTIVCVMTDDGEFTVPPAVLAHAPLPDTARVTLTRREVRTHPIDADRALRYEGRVTAEGLWQID